MYEQECDLVLSTIYNWENIIAPTDASLRVEVSKIMDAKDIVTKLHVITAILVVDGNLKVDDGYYIPTHKGHVFLNTTSYVKEKHKLDLIKKLNDRETEKLELDIKMHKWLLKTRWLPHILALVGIILSIIALIVSLRDST